jgi:hypothetical protein
MEKEFYIGQLVTRKKANYICRIIDKDKVFYREPRYLIVWNVTIKGKKIKQSRWIDHSKLELVKHKKKVSLLKTFINWFSS